MKLLLLIHIFYLSAVFCKFHLPNTSQPNNYELFLHIDVDGGIFNGTVKINLNVSEPTDRISLNYKDIIIHTESVDFKDENSNTYNLREAIYNDTSEIAEFIFDELQLGTYEFYVAFDGLIRNDLKGLYMSYYWTEDGQQHQAATTFLASIYARMIFPCYDEPHYKAIFTVSVVHSMKYHALSNSLPYAPPENVIPGLMQTNFRPTPKMSTYLLAIIVSDYVGNSNAEGNFTVYSQPEQTFMTNYALSFGQESLKKLEEYFGSPYQMSKLDLVAFDDFLMGAMENWGLITFLSSRLLYDEASVTTRTLQQMSSTITHELIHQWFGNEVTAQWWSEIWLNEGFATLYQDLITDLLYPDWQLMDQFVVHTIQNSMGRDASLTTKSMNGDIVSLQDIWGVYSYIPYQKAASILRMVHSVVTDDIFKSVIKSYIQEMSYEAAIPQNLYDQFSQQVFVVNIEDFFKSWVENPGFPLITIERTYNVDNNSILRISQKRFIASDDLINVPDTKYYVPVNFATAKNPDFTNTQAEYFIMPHVSEITVELNNENYIDDTQWIIANKKATYYYRVNYDEENWRLIITALNNDPSIIATANRAQLLDDAFTLAKYGQLSYKIALDLASYLRLETEYLPITVAIKHLTGLDQIIRGTNIPFRDFLRDIFSDLYKRVTLKENRNDPHLLKLMRSEVTKFACDLEVEDCVADASNQIAINEIPPNTRPAIFCGYLRGTAQTSWPIDILHTKLSDIVQSERTRRKYSQELEDIRLSFACVNSQSLRLSILQMTLDDMNINLFSSDFNTIFSSLLLSGENGVTDALEFFEKSWNRIEEKYESLGRTIQALGEQIKTVAELDLFKKIIEEKIYAYQNITPGLRNIAEAAIAKGEENIAWLTKYSPVIGEWIEQYKSGANLMKSSIIIIIIGLFLPIMGNKIQSVF